MISFNAGEIFAMAEKIEHNGAKYYRKAAGFVTGPASSTFTKLAEMEVVHEKTFHDMRMSLSKGEKTESTSDAEGVGERYLDALADGKVFDFDADPSDRLRGDETIQDVLHTAIGLEKDSIVFYVGMRELVPDEGGKDKIDRIIAQEMNHIVILSRELAKANLQSS